MTRFAMRMLSFASLLLAAALIRMPAAGAAVSLTINGFVPAIAGGQPSYVPVEHMPTAVQFTFTSPPANGSTQPSGYICAVNATGDACKHLILPASGTFTGVISWTPPAATATSQVQIKFCPNDGNQNCKPSAVATFATPVAAQFTVAIARYTIRHTRAVHNDTVALTLLGGDFHSSPACSQTPSQTCVQGSLQGNHNNGTYTPSNATIGPFTIVPGTDGAFRFGYALFNFGAGYSTSKYNQLSASLSQILGGALTQQVALGDTALVGSPSYTDRINALNWSGCDGPLAVDLVGIYDTTKLLTQTASAGAYVITSPSYHFKSQTGCGSSPDYSLQYIITRTSWR